MYDIIIAGGGTAGCACAYIASKLGLRTLLIEKNIHLGGSITSGLVTPAMKTRHYAKNCEFFYDFVEVLKKYNGQITYSDGNIGWFNPELAKIALDEMLANSSCEILFDAAVSAVEVNNSKISKVCVSFKTLSLYFEAKYFVDATGDANLANLCNCQMLSSENALQAMTLRFIIGGVDLKKFEHFITTLDKNPDVTTSTSVNDEIHLSTAYTWEKKKWALRHIFRLAIENGDIEEKNSSYFQLFTIPAMPGCVSMNCPRIISEKEPDSLNPEDFSNALIQGRKQIYRLYVFCKNYLPGFEKSYISNIADMMGVRESRRVKGQYIYNKEDIIEKREFANPILYSSYPIDIHSSTKTVHKNEPADFEYQLPAECIKSADISNLYITGRCLSATFEAQAALRIQPSCFSTGEAAAREIAAELKK